MELVPLVPIRASFGRWEENEPRRDGQTLARKELSSRSVLFETLQKHRPLEDPTTSEIFDFEKPNHELQWIPIAARRALDVAGLVLSLDAWQRLPIDVRRAVVETGASDIVDADAVARLLAGVTPAADRVMPRADPVTIPEELILALGERTKEIEHAWPSLSPLARYALAKLARGGRNGPRAPSTRLAAACDELVTRAPALTHLRRSGDAHMVDVSDKPSTLRLAVGRASVRMQKETLTMLLSGTAPKGDVLAVARIAGIQAAKRTSELIPLCHAVALTGVDIELTPTPSSSSVDVVATARSFDRTGVEMEALVAASIAALTLYDMLKSVDRGMTITDVQLVAKSGGRSGDFRREEGI